MDKFQSFIILSARLVLHTLQLRKILEDTIHHLPYSICLKSSGTWQRFADFGSLSQAANRSRLIELEILFVRVDAS